MLACVSGTILGPAVVPDVCKTSAVSSGLATEGGSPAKPRRYNDATTSAIRPPIAGAFWATRHPAASNASILAAAVPLEPEMIAPA